MIVRKGIQHEMLHIKDDSSQPIGNIKTPTYIY